MLIQQVMFNCIFNFTLRRLCDTHILCNLQIKDAADYKKLSTVANSDLAIQVFQRCGIGKALSVS